jgi:hypothetical protein
VDTINITRAGLAGGIAGAFLSFVCMIGALLLPRGSMVYAANSIMHSIDISTIAAGTITPLQASFGFVLAFVIGWLIATSFALAYNFMEKR